MPKTIVTGGSGKVGWWSIQELVAAGHEVLAIDKVKPVEALPKGAKYWPVEMLNLGEVYQALAGADYVCHIGAIPNPTGFPGATTFQNNTIATYHVFQAAVDFGVQKIIYTSSEMVYGFLDGQKIIPEYLPVDETHPTAPQGPYGLSKKMGEDIAEMFCRNHKISAASFRLANVRSPGNYDVYPKRRKRAERQAGGLWSYVDARDGGQACVKFWESDLTGHTVFNLSAADNWLDVPVDEVKAQSGYRDVPSKEGFEGSETGWDISKAKRELGYVPKYSWRDHL
ncbi:MAG: NAD(P)-dependent oxidoreductase [Candidatus Latescibacteria bacterium]|nr:NAD(P)-dependent oxidoreductase [Candidatus Latescibacterota bacterium]